MQAGKSLCNLALGNQQWLHEMAHKDWLHMWKAMFGYISLMDTYTDFIHLSAS